MEPPAPKKALTAAQRKLVMENLQWACKVVTRLAARCRRALAPGEVQQIGHLGLSEAAQRYDPSLGVPFTGFALKPVRGAVMKALNVELRFHGPLFTAAEHWAPEGDPFEETDESARDTLYAMASEGATAMMFRIVGAATHGLSTGGEDRAIEEVMRSRLREALARVPARPREVLERRHLQGQEIAEVAGDMGISPITVRRDHEKGMTKLRKLLGADARAEEPDEAEERED